MDAMLEQTNSTCPVAAAPNRHAKELRNIWKACISSNGPGIPTPTNQATEVLHGFLHVSHLVNHCAELVLVQDK